MAMLTECQTSGAQFHSYINEESVSVKVDFGKKLPLNEKEAELLETNLHNAIELVLARYYI